jgi:hypothetical protein
MRRFMMQRVNQPPRVTVNPFLIRLHAMRKVHMQQTLIYLFGLDFVSRVMESTLPLIYPTVEYGDEWIVTIYILF